MSADPVGVVSADHDLPPRFVAQMRKGVLVYCVLALIEREPTYGRALVAALADIPGMATTNGTIYPLLGRMIRQRLITTAWGPSPKSPPRRYYQITRRGRAALREFGREWAMLRDGLEQVIAQRRRSAITRSDEAAADDECERESA